MKIQHFVIFVSSAWKTMHIQQHVELESPEIFHLQYHKCIHHHTKKYKLPQVSTNRSWNTYIHGKLSNNITRRQSPHITEIVEQNTSISWNVYNIDHAYIEHQFHRVSSQAWFHNHQWFMVKENIRRHWNDFIIKVIVVLNYQSHTSF